MIVVTTSNDSETNWTSELLAVKDAVTIVLPVTNFGSSNVQLKLGVLPAIAASNESSPCLIISSTNPNEELTLILSLSLPDTKDDENGRISPALTLLYVLSITAGTSTNSFTTTNTPLLRVLVLVCVLVLVRILQQLLQLQQQQQGGYTTFFYYCIIIIPWFS